MSHPISAAKGVTSFSIEDAEPSLEGNELLEALGVDAAERRSVFAGACPQGGTHTWLKRSTGRLCSRCNAEEN